MLRYRRGSIPVVKMPGMLGKYISSNFFVIVEEVWLSGMVLLIATSATIYFCLRIFVRLNGSDELSEHKKGRGKGKVGLIIFTANWNAGRNMIENVLADHFYGARFRFGR